MKKLIVTVMLLIATGNLISMERMPTEKMKINSSGVNHSGILTSSDGLFSSSLRVDNDIDSNTGITDIKLTTRRTNNMGEMNTMPNSNPLLTKVQYIRIMDRWENIANMIDKGNAKTRDTSEYALRTKINNLYKLIHGKPYRAYTDEEITEILWK